MMNSKGLSKIIGFILIFLIILALIVINFVLSPFFFNKSDKKSVDLVNDSKAGLVGCSGMIINSLECSVFSDHVNLDMERTGENILIKDFKFFFETSEEGISFSSLKSFGEIPQKSELKSYSISSQELTNAEIEKVRFAAILEDGTVCDFSVEANCYEEEQQECNNNEICEAGENFPGCEDCSVCGNNITEFGEQCDGSQLNGNTCSNFSMLNGQLSCSPECTFDTSQCLGIDSQPLSYCPPLDLSNGNKNNLLDAYANINSFYSVGQNMGIKNRPQVSDITVNGAALKKITFRFSPAAYNPNGPFRSMDWEHDVILFIPNPASTQIEKNYLALSMQPGTSGGNPSNSDPVRPANEIPPWYMGTDSNNNFQETYASIASDLNVPVIFYQTVPASMEFKQAIADKIKIVSQEMTPGFTCDDNECYGILSSEGAIHGCLNKLSFVDANNGWPYIDYHPTILYSIAGSRLIDASENVLNQLSTRNNWIDSNGQVYQFDFENIIAMGGSKRGVAMEKFIVVEPRVKAGLVGHANAGNYVTLQNQRISLFSNSYNPLLNIYRDEPDDISFFQGKSLWFDYYDPVSYNNNLYSEKKVIRSFGAHDTYFAQGAELLFIDSLPSGTRFLAIPNYGHGFGIVDHAVAFRSLVNNILSGGESDYMRINAKYYFNQGSVNATITGTNDFEDVRVELWCTQGDLDDFLSREEWPPILRKSISCSSIDNSDPNFNPLPPDLRYSYLSKAVMNSLGNGKYSLSVDDVPVDSGFEDYRGCYVRAVKGGQYKDEDVATSYLLLNENMCSLSLLQVKED